MANSSNSEDRLKALLKNSLNPPTPPKSAPTAPQNFTEVNIGGHISPIANIKVVGVG